MVRAPNRVRPSNRDGFLRYPVRKIQAKRPSPLAPARPASRLDPRGLMVSDDRMMEAPHRLAGRPVVKMNGIGNAILILDLRGTALVPSAAEVRAIAGQSALAFDQLMVLHDPAATGTEAFLRIYNRDGTPAGACGNGTRCVASFLLGDADRDSLTLATATARLECRRLPDGRVRVDMGAPRFGWAEIPLRDGTLDPRALDLGPGDRGEALTAFALGMGNPHAVLFVERVGDVDLAGLGPRLEHADAFPDRANISFAEVVDRNAIRLRVWERGAGATLACGSAACAAVVAAVETGRTDRAVAVDLPGGRLDIAWTGETILMTGPVAFEFAARLPVPAGCAA